MVSVATQTRKRRKTFIETGCKCQKKTRVTQTLSMPASKARSTKVGKNPPTDSDTEYTEDEADSDSDDNEDIYCPENDGDSYGSDSETELDATQMNFHENDIEIHKQPKFIVFQNQLLLLLSVCLACLSKEVAVNDHIVKGSMLTAYIKCLC